MATRPILSFDCLSKKHYQLTDPVAFAYYIRPLTIGPIARAIFDQLPDAPEEERVKGRKLLKSCQSGALLWGRQTRFDDGALGAFSLTSYTNGVRQVTVTARTEVELWGENAGHHRCLDFFAYPGNLALVAHEEYFELICLAAMYKERAGCQLARADTDDPDHAEQMLLDFASGLYTTTTGHIEVPVVPASIDTRRVGVEYTRLIPTSQEVD